MTTHQEVIAQSARASEIVEPGQSSEQIAEPMKRVLLQCLRQQVRRYRLYVGDLEMIGVALASGLVSTSQALTQLAILDGISCLDEFEEANGPTP